MTDIVRKPKPLDALSSARRPPEIPRDAESIGTTYQHILQNHCPALQSLDHPHLSEASPANIAIKTGPCRECSFQIILDLHIPQDHSLRRIVFAADDVGIRHAPGRLRRPSPRTTDFQFVEISPTASLSGHGRDRLEVTRTEAVQDKPELATVSASVSHSCGTNLKLKPGSCTHSESPTATFCPKLTHPKTKPPRPVFHGRGGRVLNRCLETVWEISVLFQPASPKPRCEQGRRLEEQSSVAETLERSS